MANKFYITTPLYYVNASPHIGHSYTNIAADTLARFMRKRIGRENVYFLTGTDEHGQKIQKAAQAEGLVPKDFCDKMVLKFRGLWENLSISYDDFIRTTEGRHTKVVREALDILYRKGEIYSAKYEGWYCTPCETFWTETQIQGFICPDCKRPLEKIVESNYFFRLSKYQPWLIDYIKANPDFIRPKTRYQEVLSFLELNKLTDLCISRPKERLSWGIPVPFSENHVTYVWFDALINYISAVGEFDSRDNYHSKWWPADLHLIGKDILRQHAIYWPIMLKALNIALPKTIFAHGWWLMGEDKMSKSKGNVISPLDMAARFGVDAYRYFLLRDIPFGLDGNFSENSIIKRINSGLANDLGNLIYRTLTMIEKYFEGTIPQVKLPFSETGQAIIDKLESLDRESAGYLSASADFNFSAILEKIWEPLNMANKYIEDTKPWNLAKENKTEELKSFIRVLVSAINKISEEISPFMPRTAELISEQFGKDRIKKGKPLFPRIDTAVLGIMFVDTHCHLDFPEFDSDRQEVIGRARQEGISYIINIGSSLENSIKSIELAQAHDFIYASVGFHPHEADAFSEGALFSLEKLLKEDKVAALGEIGLDYYKNYSDPENQRKAFISLAALGAENNLPLIIHSRQAQGDTLEILKNSLPLKAVIHCFSGSEDFLKECLDLGFFISFTCNITYKKAENLRSLVKLTPLERLLLETDSPFLSPEGSRGKRNEPVFVKHLAREIAGIKEISIEEVARVTTANAKEFFNLP